MHTLHDNEDVFQCLVVSKVCIMKYDRFYFRIILRDTRTENFRDYQILPKSTEKC